MSTQGPVGLTAAGRLEVTGVGGPERHQSTSTQPRGTLPLGGSHWRPLLSGAAEPSAGGKATSLSGPLKGPVRAAGQPGVRGRGPSSFGADPASPAGLATLWATTKPAWEEGSFLLSPRQAVVLPWGGVMGKQDSAREGLHGVQLVSAGPAACTASLQRQKGQRPLGRPAPAQLCLFSWQARHSVD